MMSKWPHLCGYEIIRTIIAFSTLHYSITLAKQVSCPNDVIWPCPSSYIAKHMAAILTCFGNSKLKVHCTLTYLGITTKLISAQISIDSVSKRLHALTEQWNFVAKEISTSKRRIVATITWLLRQR